MANVSIALGVIALIVCIGGTVVVFRKWRAQKKAKEQELKNASSQKK
jgi:glucose uptake protein GlcU